MGLLFSYISISIYLFHLSNLFQIPSRVLVFHILYKLLSAILSILCLITQWLTITYIFQRMFSAECKLTAWNIFSFHWQCFSKNKETISIPCSYRNPFDVLRVDMWFETFSTLYHTIEKQQQIILFHSLRVSCNVRNWTIKFSKHWDKIACTKCHTYFYSKNSSLFMDFFFDGLFQNLFSNDHTINSNIVACSKTVCGQLLWNE